MKQVLASVLIVAIVWVSCWTPTLAQEPLTLSSDNGSVDNWVSLHGEGFSGNSYISVTYNNVVTSTDPTLVLTHETGFFDCDFQIPETPYGEYDVIVSDGVKEEKTRFKIIEPKLLALDPNGEQLEIVASGVPFTLVGKGFSSLKNFELSLDPQVEVSGTMAGVTGCNGGFKVSLRLKTKVKVRVTVSAKDEEEHETNTSFILESALPPPSPNQVPPSLPSPPPQPLPDYTWAIIVTGAIGVILVIAVIVLIVRTRRPV